MTANAVPVFARSAPMQAHVTAAGSYTLPQHAFIPHPVLQQLSQGVVTAPGRGMVTTWVRGVAGTMQRAYPMPVYGVRSLMVNFKSSP